MGFLLHGDMVPLMEKKRTNSGPFSQSTRKHSISPLLYHPLSREINHLFQLDRRKIVESLGQGVVRVDDRRIPRVHYFYRKGMYLFVDE
jgi:hypothetical protein